MAAISIIQSYLTAVSDSVARNGLNLSFLEVTSNFTAGRPEPLVSQSDRGCNLRWYPLGFQTSSVANREVAIPHGLPSTPYLVVPCLDPSMVGAQLVPLKVTRAADQQFIYLSSPTVSAPVVVFV